MHDCQLSTLDCFLLARAHVFLEVMRSAADEIGEERIAEQLDDSLAVLYRLARLSLEGAPA